MRSCGCYRHWHATPSPRWPSPRSTRLAEIDTKHVLVVLDAVFASPDGAVRVFRRRGPLPASVRGERPRAGSSPGRSPPGRAYPRPEVSFGTGREMASRRHPGGRAGSRNLGLARPGTGGDPSRDVGSQARIIAAGRTAPVEPIGGAGRNWMGTAKAGRCRYAPQSSRARPDSPCGHTPLRFECRTARRLGGSNGPPPLAPDSTPRPVPLRARRSGVAGHCSALPEARHASELLARPRGGTRRGHLVARPDSRGEVARAGLSASSRDA